MWVLNSATGIDEVALLRCQGQDCGYMFTPFAVDAVFCNESGAMSSKRASVKVGGLETD